MKRGSKTVGLKSFINHAFDVDPELIIKKFNELCRQADDPKFIPHLSTWLNHHRWEEELPSKKGDVPISRDMYETRIKMFNGEITNFVKVFAKQHEQDVREGVRKGDLSKERAKELGIEVG